MTKEQLIKEIYTYISKSMGVNFKKKNRNTINIIAFDIFTSVSNEVLNPFFKKRGECFEFIAKFTNRKRVGVFCSVQRIELKLLQFPEYKKIYDDALIKFRMLSNATDIHKEIDLRTEFIRLENEKINQLKKKLECI